MRFSLLAFWLCSGLLFAQCPASQVGNVSIAGVDLTPDSSVSSEELAAVVAEIRNCTYSPYGLFEIKEQARYTLQRYGFFKADVSLADSHAVNSNLATIAITLAIRSGAQYRLGQITFAANKAISTAELRAQFLIAGGDVFDVEKIRHGLEAIRALYCSRGYINFAPIPNTVADDDTGAVYLKIEVDEGKQFRFGALTVKGHELHPGDRQKMLAAWESFVGGVFNPEELEQFWKDMAPFMPREWASVQYLVIRQEPQTAIANLEIDLPGTY
jgi:outer membrane protein assembly factor BamA